jgi:hypothetical protein
MAKLSLTGLQPIAVDLNGTEFDAVPATKSVAEALDAAWEEYGRAEGVDASIKALGAVFDLRLKPQGDAKKKASAIVKEMWEANQATFAQLVGFLAEAGQEADRPT